MMTVLMTHYPLKKSIILVLKTRTLLVQSGSGFLVSKERTSEIFFAIVRCFRINNVG